MKIFKVKNILKKPSKKSFGKIGLFLIFGIILAGVNSGVEENKNSLVFKNSAFAYGNATELGAPPGADEYDEAEKAVGDGEGNEDRMTVRAFNWLLWGITVVISKLNLFAAYIFDNAVDVDFIRGQLADEKIYQAWTLVRDFLNLFFMLILLFSAFATIFQVEKYHLKKMIVLLIVMALLVNFSYPITLFIIDLSNSAMYYFINAIPSDEISTSKAASKSSLIAKIANMGVLNEKLIKGNAIVTSQLVFSILVMFILFITLFAFALNLFIRVFALSVLLIFSPAGFVLSFFPGTKSVADSWWNALFKYAIMGPVLAFFLMLAVFLFDKTNAIDVNKEEGFMRAIAGFAMPVIFLWMGLIASGKFGGMASGAAMNVAKNVGNRVRGYAQRGALGTARIAGRGADDYVTGNRISGTAAGIGMRLNSLAAGQQRRRERAATGAAAALGTPGANETLARQIRKEWADGDGVADNELMRLQEHGTDAERMAVAMERSEKNRYSNDGDEAMQQYQAGRVALQNNVSLTNTFETNTRKNNVDLIIRDRSQAPGANVQQVAEEEFGRLKPDQWADQNIGRIVDVANPNSQDMMDAGNNVIGQYSAQAQDNVTRNMNGPKRAAGRHVNNGGNGLWA